MSSRSEESSAGHTSPFPNQDPTKLEGHNVKALCKKVRKLADGLVLAGQYKYTLTNDIVKAFLNEKVRTAPRRKQAIANNFPPRPSHYTTRQRIPMPTVLILMVGPWMRACQLPVRNQRDKTQNHILQPSYFDQESQRDHQLAK